MGRVLMSAPPVSICRCWNWQRRHGQAVRFWRNAEPFLKDRRHRAIGFHLRDRIIEGPNLSEFFGIMIANLSPVGTSIETCKSRICGWLNA